MSEPKYREWILETIDSLRSRKARPDLERICRMVRRRHGSDPDRTRAELEKLIQEQTVLKVSYKGSISYRNAAKVQRKSRKRGEFTPAGVSAEAARERTKRGGLSNNGDSAHSLTDQEKGEDDPEPGPGHRPRTSTSAAGKKPLSSPSSGNGRLVCGAPPSCAAGSECGEEKASALREKGLGHRPGVNCPSASHGHTANVLDDLDDKTAKPAEADAIRGRIEPGLPGVAADTEDKTCPGSVSSGDGTPPERPKYNVSLKPKVRVGGGGGGEGAISTTDQDNSDLGDRLVASVHSLSQINLRGGSGSAARGQMKPLGVKEILDYLSSQERLSEEMLTRGKVKVVLEREVEKGRLRRTRCGNITLPLRRLATEQPPKNGSADSLLKSGLQDRHTPKKVSYKGDEPMETDSGEAEQEEDEGDDPRSSDEEGGLSTVTMVTEPSLNDKSKEDAEIQTAPKQESPQRQHHCIKDVSELPGSLTKVPCLPAQEGLLSYFKSEQLEQSVVSPSQLLISAQDQRQQEGGSDTSSGFNSLCKTEVGVSSCPLTPTASPKDSSLSEEPGINGGINRGMFTKADGISVSPVNWTVSDVANYITAAGFPEQAVAFRTQEIDGKSLLLMQRNDVLTGLSIRLGPALKIYERHVKVLQKTHFEDDDC
ncbi:sterile alpha motif domain-containing protein 1 [Lampris incognitus]|uniref:sterile alpha motif domain-containing protein 1 n=1 Tax=Lampris incognitus TaxID=2546036 RepID=UPI0024B5B699|nr:sterile alpha motif domain-containing protein 1 [Lampris incognitus]